MSNGNVLPAEAKRAFVMDVRKKIFFAVFKEGGEEKVAMGNHKGDLKINQEINLTSMGKRRNGSLVIKSWEAPK